MKVVAGLSAMLLMGAACLTTSGSAYSAERYAYERIYYSDASKTEVVGEEFVGCDVHNRVLTGQRSIYNETLWQIDCNIVPGQDLCDGFVPGTIVDRYGNVIWTCPFYGSPGGF